MSPEATGGGKDPYLSSQLIPYLGSKRALLPLLREVFGTLAEGASRAPRFLDPFCGSGAVSRLARRMGMSVAANDHEPYAALIASVWLRLDPAALEAACPPEGAIARLGLLNALHPERGGAPPGTEARGFFARNYAPAVTAAADWRRERLFYTAENAAFMDRVLDALRGLPESPPGALPGFREIALAALTLEAAVHANTSGVFKACHKGFGGHSGDALARILAPMRLEAPFVVHGAAAEVAMMDAADFARSRPVDLAYLDPPYNQHQYGSNYHLLNAVVRFGGDEPGLELGADGTLLDKAGIGSAWKATRSDFCSRAKAGAAYRSLLDAVDAACIVVSANTEGSVGFDELLDILGERGSVELRIADYVRYRGGRQSASRRVRNHELILVVDSRRGERPGKGVATERRRLSAELSLRKILAQPLDPARLERAFTISDDAIELPARAGGVRIRLDLGVRAGSLPDTSGFDDDELEALSASLSDCVVADNGRLCAILASVGADPERSEAEARRAFAEALAALRRLAHAKHAAAFAAASAALAEAAGRRGGEPSRKVQTGLRELEDLLDRRSRASGR
ncbi:MAG: DNA adenine methylase [Spirochaetales bacterium]|nr:DNA adenine methylase [Spirochaetales bacterium]